MSVSSNVIKPQGLEPLQFPTKFRSHSEELEISVEAPQTFEEQHKKEFMVLEVAHQELRTAVQALSGAQLASDARDKA